MDSDFLFIRPTGEEDFFWEGKPVWFYHDWIEGEPRLRWRADSEKLLQTNVKYNYNDISQWVFKKSIAEKLASIYSLSGILNKNTILEFLVYAQFAYDHYRQEYKFVSTSGTRLVSPVVERINQIPPDYLHLDPTCTFQDFPHNKCVVFWSHWELAEEEMAQFLEDSQRANFGRIVLEPDRRRLRPLVDPPGLAGGNLNGVEGVYADGWVKASVEMYIAIPSAASEMSVLFDIPGDPDWPDWRLRVESSWDEALPSVATWLSPGEEHFTLHLDAGAAGQRRLLCLRFGDGLRGHDPADSREFRARLRGIEFASRGFDCENQCIHG
jgi:hypothetical protein